MHRMARKCHRGCAFFSTKADMPRRLWSPRNGGALGEGRNRGLQPGWSAGRYCGGKSLPEGWAVAQPRDVDDCVSVPGFKQLVTLRRHHRPTDTHHLIQCSLARIVMAPHILPQSGRHDLEIMRYHMSELHMHAQLGLSPVVLDGVGTI